MSALLLRLAGPMQSWGTQSRFTVRDTGFEPSKSGVAGLLSAALGRPRNESVDDLAALRMGVRVDCEGSIAVDYHTAQKVVKADGSTPDTVTSNRYYLADADFLVGLEGEPHLLRTLNDSLASPRWPLYLGRKAFVPGKPVWIADGLRRSEDLEAALRRWPWAPHPHQEGPGKRPERLRLVLEVPSPQGEEVRTDQPVGNSFQTRMFGLRHVQTEWLPFDSVTVREEEE